MVGLYGRISVREAFGIIQRQNDAQYSKRDFVDYLETMQKKRESAKHPETFFFLFSPDDYNDVIEMEIVNDSFETDCYEYDDNNPYYTLIADQSHLPLYVPPKEELLKYADDDYDELTPGLPDIIDWVLKHQCELPFKLTPGDIISEFTVPIRGDGDYFEAIDGLLKWVEIPHEHNKRTELLNELSRLCMSAYGGVRQWSLRGHSPNEIGGIIGDIYFRMKPRPPYITFDE